MPNNKKREVSYLDYLRSNPDKIGVLSYDTPEGMEASPSQYDKGFIIPSENKQAALEQSRGTEQGAGAEFTNAVVGGIAKVPFTIIGNVASILDFEDYANQDNEVGNAITKWSEDVKKSIGQELPIYKSNDSTLSSREWWMQNGQELINSAGAFALTGMGIGSGLKVLNGLKSVGLGADAIKGIGTTVNAVALNQAESVPIAMNVFDKSYNIELARLQPKVENGEISPEDADNKAKQFAADNAAYSVQINRINIPLNLTSAGAFVRTPQMTRQLAKDVSKNQIRNKVLSEGAQEYTEENINMIAENESIRKAQEGNKYVYNFDNTVKDVLSKEGFEQGLVGFLGGALQTGATSITEDYIKKDSPSFDEEGNVRFDEAGNPIGTSRVQSQKERFAAQQNNLRKIEAITATENLPTLKKTLEKTQYTARIINDIQEAALNNDDFKVDQLQNELLSTQALDAFKTGSTQKLVDLYKSIGNEPEAEAKYGNDYKKRSLGAVKQIENLESVYNKLPKNQFTNELFLNRANHNYLLKASENLNREKSQALQEQAREIQATGYNTPEMIATLATTVDVNKINDKLEVVKNSVIELNNQFNDILSGNFVKPEVAEQSVENEVITDEQYKEFVDNNIVAPEVLNAIADKIVNNQPRTPREVAIATEKNNELEAILQEKSSKIPTQTPENEVNVGETVQSDADFANFLSSEEPLQTQEVATVETVPVVSKDTPEQSSKINDDVFIPEILTSNIQPSEFKPLKGGAYAVMMKLYLHERKNLIKNKIFKWLRESGVPIKDNNSGIDADFVNSPDGLKVGDVVEYRITELTGEAFKNNLESIADITDVDRKYLQPIGMYVNDKLIGFYRLPNESDTENTESRNTVIEERKKIIDRLDEGALVETAVKEKGAGNVLTKTSNAKDWLLPINNGVFNRPQDRIAGIDVYGYVSSTGNFVVPPVEGATEQELAELSQSVNKLVKIGKPGYIYKLVRAANNKWMPIPIYRKNQENLDLFKLNTKEEQDRLYADNTLQTNAFTEGGNFYVQPYIEVYPVDEVPDTLSGTEIEKNDTNVPVQEETISQFANQEIEPLTPEQGVTDTGVEQSRSGVSTIINNNPKVSLNVVETEDAIELITIFVKEEDRGNKLATKALSDIKKYADKTNKPVILKVTDELGGDVAKLKDFYTRNGFVNTKDNEYVYTPFIKNNEQRDVLFQSTSTDAKANEKLTIRLKEFLANNKINVEFVDVLLDRNGNNVVAAYDTTKKLIQIASGKGDVTTLPEETAHAAIRLLGKNHPLIKNLFTQVSKLDYKTILGPRYVELYNNNDELLIEELAGKYLADSIIKGEATPIQKGLLQRIWDRVKQFFTKLTASNLDKIQQEITGLTKELSGKILLGENIGVVVPVRPDNQFFYQVENIKKDDVKPKGTAKIKNLRQLLNNSIKERDKLDPASEEYKLKNVDINDLRNQIQEFEKTGSEQVLIDVGTKVLNHLEDFLKKLDSGKIKLDGVTSNDLIYLVNTAKQFGTGTLRRKAENLIDRAKNTYAVDVAVEESNKLRNKKTTKSEILSENSDISAGRYWFASLGSIPNVLGSTIGNMIKAAQNRISETNKKAATEIENEVNLLKEYAKKKGKNISDIYDIFIQELGGSTVLTKKFTTKFYEDFNKAKSDAISGDDVLVQEAKDWGKKHIKEIKDGEIILKDPKSEYVNKDYITIQNTPELKRFYDFHQKQVLKLREKLPVNFKEDFIANVRREGLDNLMHSEKSVWNNGKQMLQDFFKIKDLKTDDMMISADIDNDVLNSNRFQDPLTDAEKSRDLGQNLFKLVEYANHYEEMVNILPKTRFLQDVIESKGELKSAWSPNKAVSVDKSNLIKLINAYRDMQIKGNMTKPMFKPIPVGEDKQVRVEDLLNTLLSVNSMLRIGFNPFSAISNVAVGKISNLLEAAGGRYFNKKEWGQGNKIFLQQGRNKDSVFNKVLEIINPLQELTDYDNVGKVAAKTGSKLVSVEKAKELAYSLQKYGERVIQSPLVAAIMIHDGLMTSDGKLTTSGEALLTNPESIDKFRNKVQEIVNQIHGRYSAQDASAASQNILFKMAFQFRKFLPAAFEARFQGRYYNDKLGKEVQGRWITFKDLVLGKAAKGIANIATGNFSTGIDNVKDAVINLLQPTFGYKAALESGKFTELDVYNMRKNMAEITIILALLAMKAGLTDEDKRKKAWYKITMDQLSRVSGDLLFFLSPEQMSQPLKNVVPSVRVITDLQKAAVSVVENLYTDDYTYKSGEKKGENKALANVIAITPGLNEIAAITRKFKDIPYSNPGMSK